MTCLQLKHTIIYVIRKYYTNSLKRYRAANYGIPLIFERAVKNCRRARLSGRDKSELFVLKRRQLQLLYYYLCLA